MNAETHSEACSVMTALLSSVASALFLAEQEARSSQKPLTQTHGTPKKPFPPWVLHAQEILLNYKRLYSLELSGNPPDNLNSEIKSHIKNSAMHFPIAYALLSPFPNINATPLHAFTACASTCSQRLTSSGFPLTTQTHAPQLTFKSSITSKLKLLRLNGKQEDGLVDGLVGEAGPPDQTTFTSPSSPEKTLDFSAAFPTTKTFRVNPSALQQIIRNSLRDYTRDKSTGPTAFSFSAIAAHCLYNNDHWPDNCPRSTLIDSPASVSQRCATALKAWQTCASIAHDLTCMPARSELIEATLTKTFGGILCKGNITHLTVVPEMPNKPLFLYHVHYHDNDAEDIDFFELMDLEDLNGFKPTKPKNLVWKTQLLKDLVETASKAFIALPPPFTEFLSSNHNFEQSNTHIPYDLAKLMWHWSIHTDTEYNTSEPYLKKSVLRLHDSLKVPAHDDPLAEEFMEVIEPFHTIKELKEHLHLLNENATSGPLGLTAKHFLNANQETLEALLLLCQASFAGIFPRQAKNGEILVQSHF